MTAHAKARNAAGESMPGVVAVAVGAQLAAVIDDLLLLAIASEPPECEGRILYVPLR